MPKKAEKKPAAKKKAGKNNQIGTEKESSLHRALKFRYTGGGKTEVPVGLYVADGIRGDGEIIEVQTGSFGPLKQKAKELGKKGNVRIVHPIILTKQIAVFDCGGELLYKRKSPRKGNEWDLFKALLYAPELAFCPGVTIELAMVDILENRIKDGKGSWRRKGISITGKELAAWHSSIILKKKQDYRRFIPFKASETFTVADLADKTRIDTALARKTLYVLTKMNVTERIGKKGRSFLYKICDKTAKK
jgi:hypothetical protein